jgi:malate dehydrogenase
MVPLANYSSVDGKSLEEFFTTEEIEDIIVKTRNGGAQIVKLLETGSAYYAPSASAVQMAEAILKDQKRILPCAVELSGEYGMKGLFIGVLCKLGGKGMESVVELKLNETEMAGLQKSARAVEELVGALKNIQY